MTVQIKAPAMGESIAEAIVAKWTVKEGDLVAADQMVAELETDKVNLEVIAPAAGRITGISAAKGATVKVGQVMAEIDETATGAASHAEPATSEAAKAPAMATPEASTPMAVDARVSKSGPAVQKLVAESGKDTSGIAGSGKDGRLTKGDVTGAAVPVAAAAAPVAPAAVSAPRAAGALQERVPMTRIRKTIAGRLKQAQNTAAMLTTYNEVDLSKVNEMRRRL